MSAGPRKASTSAVFARNSYRAPANQTMTNAIISDHQFTSDPKNGQNGTVVPQRLYIRKENCRQTRVDNFNSALVKFANGTLAIVVGSSAQITEEIFTAAGNRTEKDADSCVGGASLNEAWVSSSRLPGFSLGPRVPLAGTARCCVFYVDCVRLTTVLSRVRLQRSFGIYPDCTPKHPFVDPAPACEESPDYLSARNYSFCDRPGRHDSSQSRRRHRTLARANAEIQCAHSD